MQKTDYVHPDPESIEDWEEEYPFEGVMLTANATDHTGNEQKLSKWVPAVYLHGDNAVDEGEIDILDGEVFLNLDTGNMGFNINVYRPHEGEIAGIPPEMSAYRRSFK